MLLVLENSPDSILVHGVFSPDKLRCVPVRVAGAGSGERFRKLCAGVGSRGRTLTGAAMWLIWTLAGDHIVHMGKATAQKNGPCGQTWHKDSYIWYCCWGYHQSFFFMGGWRACIGPSGGHFFCESKLPLLTSFVHQVPNLKPFRLSGVFSFVVFHRPLFLPDCTTAMPSQKVQNHILKRAKSSAELLGTTSKDLL